MAYIIHKDLCEAVADCVPVCPVDCIHPGEGTNAKGTNFFYVDEPICISCGACLAACPIDGAIDPD